MENNFGKYGMIIWNKKIGNDLGKIFGSKFGEIYSDKYWDKYIKDISEIVKGKS